MHALIVYCHPEPHSFNAALKAVATETLEHLGYTVEVSDLYAEGFDPVEGGRHYADRRDPECFAALAEQRHASRAGTLPADVRREIARLERADLVVFQFPLWWHAQPAMLKGWFDRVFVSGGLYTSTMRYDRGYFRGRRAIVSVTSGAPAEAFGPGARAGDVAGLLWPFQYSLHYMGFTVMPPNFSFGVQGHGYSYLSDEVLKTHLAGLKDQWRQRLEALATTPPLWFPGWDDWDDGGRLKCGKAEACTAS